MASRKVGQGMLGKHNALKGLYERGVGQIFAWGKVVPADGAKGFAPGCIFIHIDGSGPTDLVFVNEGDKASADFDSTHS